MKRHFVLLCVVALLLSALPIVASASNNKETDTEVQFRQEETAASYEEFFSVDSIFCEDNASVDNVLFYKRSSVKTPFNKIDGTFTIC